MSIVDEIQVTENGDIEVRIIPPDSLSTLPDVLATYRPGTQAREYIMDRCLRRIAHGLEISCDIVSLVHGGEDRYTVITSDGDYVEIDAASNKAISDAINDLASLVETLEFVQHNRVPDMPPTTHRRDYHVHVNRVPVRTYVTRKLDHFLSGILTNDSPHSGYLPGELNTLPATKRRKEDIYERPNRLRRAS